MPCEILLRVTDKTNDDFYLNTKCTKRGDIIVVSPSLWAWGKDELSLPFWRILVLPNVDQAIAETFLAPELDIDPLQPSATLQRRVFRLDIDSPTIALVAGLSSYLADNLRGQPAFVADTLDNTRITTLKVAKLSIVDPKIIGPPSTTIGP